MSGITVSIPLRLLLITLFIKCVESLHSELGRYAYGSTASVNCYQGIFGLNALECARECLLRPGRCGFFNYYRHVRYCQLCENSIIGNGRVIDENLASSDVTLWSKTLVGACAGHQCPDPLRQRCALDDTNTNRSSDCVFSECSDPPVVLGASIDTTFRGVGTNVTYKCQTQNNTLSVKSTCLTDANWSEFNISCPCVNPPSVTNADVDKTSTLIGQYVTYTCPSSLYPTKDQMTSECQSDGTWSSVASFGCECGPVPPKENAVAITTSSPGGTSIISATYQCKGTNLVCDGPTSVTVTCESTGWTSTNFKCALNTGSTNMALHKSTSQSSFDYLVGADPTGQPAVDGTEHDLWDRSHCISTLTEARPWWRVDLGKLYIIKHVRVFPHFNNTNCVEENHDFQVNVGTELSSLTLCNEMMGLTCITPLDFVCPVPMCGQYVELRIVKGDKNAITVCEVEVYSTENL